MTADELKALAREYVHEDRSSVDVVEIAAFVEWAYAREGKPVPPMSTLEQIEP